MRIAVLMGGDSPERDVSLASGKAVAAGLRQAGHDVDEMVIDAVRDVISLAALRDVDLVFPALHGGQGEDGHLQALLDVLGVPYALSGAAASALAMDKGHTKRVARAAGIPTPDWLQVTWDADAERPDAVVGRAGPERGAALTPGRVLDRVAQELGFPVVVKLNGAGSSVGIEIVETPGRFAEAFERVVAAGRGRITEVILEKYIPGRELTATVLLGRRLPLLEIRPRQGFYDYRNKYTSGASEYLVPAPVHSPVYEQISADALRLYELIGCRGVARVDFRLDGDAYYCLEINTIPGMTETSLVPKAAAAVGIGFPALLDDVCRAALAE
jgi:D-alanine-D-alanine ligase